MNLPALEAQAPAPPSDEEIAQRVLAGEVALFELLMRRHNQRVYRCVRSILRDEAEVEDVMQQAYVAAWTHLRQFQHGARFTTWLSRIAINEALMRLRKRRRLVSLEGGAGAGAEEDTVISPENPEREAARHELRSFLQDAVDALPELYRTAFLLREVEGLSTAETAEVLETNEEVVKTRLHRARVMLRERLQALTEQQLSGVFPFEAPRCDRVVAGVLARLGPAS